MRFIIFLFSFLCLQQSQAATPVERVKRLAALRSEVELLNTQLGDMQESKKDELQSLIVRKSELDASIQQEELKQKQLLSKLSRLKKQMGALSSSQSDNKRKILQSIADIRSYVLASLPYKKETRLQALEKMEKGIEGGSIPVFKAAAQVWSFVEDELRLTKENSLSKQTIELEGKQFLVEVAKLGMLNMYFRTEDGKLGGAFIKDDEWIFSWINNESAKNQIAFYFDSLKKRIATGEFTLPGNYQLRGL